MEYKERNCTRTNGQNKISTDWRQIQRRLLCSAKSVPALLWAGRIKPTEIGKVTVLYKNWNWDGYIQNTNANRPIIAAQFQRLEEIQLPNTQNAAISEYLSSFCQFIYRRLLWTSNWNLIFLSNKQDALPRSLSLNLDLLHLSSSFF